MKFSTTLLAIGLAAISAIAAPIPVEKADLDKRGAHQGRATWYKQGGRAGSCGWVSGDYDMVIATSGQRHKASACGKWVTVRRGSKSIRAKISDTCPGCAYNDIDLSVGAFKALGKMSEGVISVSWGSTA